MKKNGDRTIDRVEARRSSIPPLTYPPRLPIADKIGEIKSAIRNNQVIVVTGETGSGKTTQLPKICLESGRGIYGKIGCTQPRRIAATSLARQVAKELKTDLGDLVGYKIRFENRVRDETLVQFATDGILLTEIQRDRYLSAYDTIIIDEAHERTLNIDFLLGYLKRILPKRRDLKLIVTSATIDVEKFSDAFPQFFHVRDRQFYLSSSDRSGGEAETAGAPVIEVSGRMYPVEVRYRPIDEMAEEQGDTCITAMVREAVEEILTETSQGDILVFLSGVQEIKESEERLQFLRKEGFDVLPLYGRLSGGEQNRIFRTGPKRKIILSTNIAETSITIPRIHYVVDSGRARISRYNARSGTQGLPVDRISQSSAEQRKGRCGRVSHGVCIRLYSEEDFHSRSRHSTPEIQRSDLSAVILRLMHLGLGDIRTFPFIDPPEPSQIRAGYRTLKELRGIVDTGRLSPLGREMAALPVDPRTACMILRGRRERVLQPVLIIAAAISCQDPREYPEDKKPQAQQKHARFHSEDSDLLSLLGVWEFYHKEWEKLKTQNKMRKFCKSNFLSYRKMREWRDIHAQLLDIARENRWNRDRTANLDYGAVHRCILAGYLTHIAKRGEKRLYLGTKNRELLLFPGSGQYKSRHEWIVAIEILETSRLFAHRVAKIDPEWLEELAGDLCRKSWTLPRWDPKNSRVVATETVKLFGFTIVDRRTVNYGPIDRAESTEVFIREALVEGNFNGNFPFWRHNCRLIESIRKQEDKTRRRNLLADSSVIERFYRERIADVSCLQDLQKLINRNSGDRFLFLSEKDVLLREREETEQLYPETIKIGDKECALQYRFDPETESDGVTVHLPQSLLNNVQNSSFEYLVPGLLLDKITWLIKNLPKETRRKLTPIPQKAQLVWEEMTSPTYSVDSKGLLPQTIREFYQNLSDKLFDATRVHVPPENWNRSELPDYFKMHFSVVDPKTGRVRTSRNLTELQGEGTKRKEDWNRLVGPLEQHQISDWSFPSLIEKVPLSHQDSLALWGYRTLTGDESGLKITFSKTKKEAETKSQEALPLLLERKLGADLGWLYRELRFPEETLDRFQNLWQQSDTKIDAATFEALKGKFAANRHTKYKHFHDRVRDAAFAMIRSGLFGYRGVPLWTQNAFEERVVDCRRQMNGLSRHVIDWIASALKRRQEVLADIAGRFPVPNQFGDRLKEELAFFLNADCLTEIPLRQWPHCLRLLKVYQRRAERYSINSEREEARWKEIEPYRKAAIGLWRERETASVEKMWQIQQLKWMVEEFKVSIYAQELKTPFPVSPKRLDAFLQDIK